MPEHRGSLQFSIADRNMEEPGEYTRLIGEFRKHMPGRSC
jgi:hypothetical protein